MSYRQPEFRQDPTSGRWVIISPQRAERPQEFDVRRKRLVHGPCPFCPGNEHLTPTETFAKYAAAGNGNREWRVRIVPNKYPAVIAGQAGSPEPSGKTLAACSSDGGQFCPSLPACGIHEVIVETPRHIQSLSQFEASEFADFMETLQGRLKCLQEDSHLEYALVFKNVGAAAGASIEHTHSQLIATPLVPGAVAAELQRSQVFHAAHSQCLFCRLLERELSEEVRLVAASEQFVAFCPFAPRFPLEVWVAPRDHQVRLEELPAGYFTAFGEVLKTVIRRLEATVPDVGYNLVFHNAPLRGEWNFYHWHVEILPSTGRPAGFEWGGGIHINPVYPEQAAQTLRGG